METTFSPEEQAILDAKNTPADTSEVPEGYNEDGTPKEELIAGKFKSNEDLLKAYQELEKKLGQPKDTEPKKEEPTDAKTPDEVTNLITPDDFNQYSEEFNKDGKLSEDTYKALEKKGLSKQLVDAYIEGEKLKAETKANKLLDYVGGKEIYDSMVEWARANYSAEQAKAFDDALFSGNEARVTEQVDLLSFRMSKANFTPRRVEGQSVSSGGMAAFKDKGEWQQAVSNPLYGKDIKYTSMVDKRYLASRKLGTL